MSVMKPSLQRQVREALADLESPVHLAVFTTGDGDALTCEICEDTRQLIEELAWLSDGRISAAVYDLGRDAEVARKYGVDKVPATVVLGGAEPHKDYGIRFFGIPTGYEFATLIEDIKMVSAGRSGLAPATLEALSKLATPLRIQVYVTPTCPYCPPAVFLAHQLALASDLVTGEMVDASEFPALADRYRVHGVPRTVINDTVHIEGAVPEAALMAELAPMLGR